MKGKCGFRPAVATLLVALFAFAHAGTASAQASGNASCMGIEASGISPPGTSTEFSGGVKDLRQAFREFAAGLGVSPGALTSGFAKLREGSHEACDEAAG
jgi:hypothetical protein